METIKCKICGKEYKVEKYLIDRETYVVIGTGDRNVE